jgi:hypothetical protein
VNNNAVQDLRLAVCLQFGFIYFSFAPVCWRFITAKKEKEEQDEKERKPLHRHSVLCNWQAQKKNPQKKEVIQLICNQVKVPFKGCQIIRIFLFYGSGIRVMAKKRVCLFPIK